MAEDKKEFQRRVKALHDAGAGKQPSLQLE